ncbi:hypothetical protein FOA52_012532 [Chlamydomonas sp. UWO 241]|nr:hypothetical protein FOA52_012532 [Chlamydomonas sp. UWO 241]
MGKNDFLAPKAVDNRSKAKGLQKLRWYCQLCQKQCRDENGFKCHQMADSHRRQMEVFGMNPHRVIEGFSEEFEGEFLEHLKRAHPFSRVAAKNVYNEYIGDKNHVHMNSTKWLTLTDFVKYLGREGKCKVDETEKGWFITLIQRDPMEEIEEEKRLKRTAAEKEEEDRHQSNLNDQVERARKMARMAEGGDDEAGARELNREGLGNGPVVLGLGLGVAAGSSAAGPSGAGGRGLPQRPASKSAAFADDDDDTGPSNAGHKLSKVEALMKQEMEAKAKEKADAEAAENARAVFSAKVDNWLVPGIVVKVMSKELKEHGYYKAKGTVERVIDKYVGEISMADSGDVVRVDQAQLETVLPAPGGKVIVVNGRHRGRRGTLERIDTERFQAKVALGGDEATWLEYEDVCKLA